MSLNFPVLFGANAKTMQHLFLPGLIGNYGSTPNSSAIDLVNDIEVEMRLSFSSWTPSANSILIAKTNSASARSWRLTLTTSRTLSLAISTSGTADNASAASGVLPFESGTGLIKFDRQASTGRVRFFYSTAGGAWTQSGSDATISTGSLFSNTAPLEIGSWLGGSSGPLAARVHRVKVRNGIDGPLVFDFDASRAVPGATQVRELANNAIVTINQSGTNPARIIPA